MQYERRFLSESRRQDKARPRFLPHWKAPRPCSWPDCQATATNAHKDKVYCASHLLKTLQQQWQE